MSHDALRRKLPRALDRHLWHFENAIEDAVSKFAASLPARARVLDAGAGEGQYRRYFGHTRYVGADLGIGDAAWDYRKLNVLCDLTSLPFRPGTFDACLNVVTLEHVRDPARVVQQMGQALRAGGQLLLIAPQDWQVHQSPNDFFRYTRYGLAHLLEAAGFTEIRIQAGGGYFRLMGRRMLNGIDFFRGFWAIPAALLLAPAGLLFPLFDGLDRSRDFTLGYLCTAIKR